MDVDIDRQFRRDRLGDVPEASRTGLSLERPVHSGGQAVRRLM